MQSLREILREVELELKGLGNLHAQSGTRLLKQNLSNWVAKFELDQDTFNLKKFSRHHGIWTYRDAFGIPRDDATIEGEVFLNKVRMSQLNINQKLPESLLGELSFGYDTVSQRTPLLRENKMEQRWNGPMRFGNLNYGFYRCKIKRCISPVLFGTEW